MLNSDWHEGSGVPVWLIASPRPPTRSHVGAAAPVQRTEIAEVRTEIANLDTRLSTQISTAETRL